MDEISNAEVVDYLSELYYAEGKAFMYVESFLKMIKSYGDLSSVIESEQQIAVSHYNCVLDCRKSEMRIKF